MINLAGAPVSALLELSRPYAAIENGIAASSDPTLKERLGALRTERDIARVALDRASTELRPEARIADEKTPPFDRDSRERLPRRDSLPPSLYPRRHR